eukprot:TRINITY_DN26656_c0_g1_i1.p1 TRINITY_DN26656_c0_g1~~TRINITY_DN26656_c0_g1_i1.p1  ORF type:complete len:149 (-),score=41.01 TRINITY_DN26656_c0_g1_i1:134-523(-)
MKFPLYQILLLFKIKIVFSCFPFFPPTPTTATDRPTSLQPIWKKVYSLNTIGGLFSSIEEAKKKNIDDPGADLFSILFDLESMRNGDGLFHFKLCYPDLRKVAIEWLQSSNPVNESTVAGYTAMIWTGM